MAPKQFNIITLVKYTEPLGYILKKSFIYVGNIIVKEAVQTVKESKHLKLSKVT